MATYPTIPLQLRVGFNFRDSRDVSRVFYRDERPDKEFEVKLGFVSYQKVNKEYSNTQSWRDWRNKDIEPLDTHNDPTEGFCVTGVHDAHDWGHFERRSDKIVLSDPRGFCVEVSVANFVDILGHYDVVGGEIKGPLIYGFNRQTMVLLPTTGDFYKLSKRLSDVAYGVCTASTDGSEYVPVAGTVYAVTATKHELYLGKHVVPVLEVFVKRKGDEKWTFVSSKGVLALRTDKTVRRMLGGAVEEKTNRGDISLISLSRSYVERGVFDETLTEEYPALYATRDVDVYWRTVDVEGHIAVPIEYHSWCKPHEAGYCTYATDCLCVARRFTKKLEKYNNPIRELPAEHVKRIFDDWQCLGRLVPYVSFEKKPLTDEAMMDVIKKAAEAKGGLYVLMQSISDNKYSRRRFFGDMEVYRLFVSPTLLAEGKDCVKITNVATSEVVTKCFFAPSLVAKHLKAVEVTLTNAHGEKMVVPGYSKDYDELVKTRSCCYHRADGDKLVPRFW